MIENIQCILFDCDGVLVDSEKIGNQILLEMASSFGLEMTLEDALQHFNGRSLKASFEYIESQIQQQLPDHFETEYRRRTFEAFQTQLEPIAGVREFIENLKIPFCVASSGPVEKIRLNLASTDLLTFFEGKIFSSYQINSWKPEPEIFLHASREMGFSPQDCLVIEDSASGVIAGVRGGFHVYALAQEHNEATLREAGATTFRSFEELRKLL